MEGEVESIEVPVWYRGGTMMVRRDALPSEHPESQYRYIRDKLGLRPEDYGVFPDPATCPTCGRPTPTEASDE